ncbi:unnamed protein product [Orchesella dallaii]|uniref:Gustatory receptor n=1 Tax=Orchesella dallaii TaxID=48710 RepID=A0ABP1S8D2_9HEXA
MLTPRFLRVLSIYLRVTSRYFYAIPFEVTKTGSNMELRMSRDSRHFILFHIILSCQCETVMYSFLRLCQMYFTGRYNGMSSYLLHLFNMVGFGYPVYLQIFLVFYGKSVCDLFNLAIKYDQQLRQRYWNQNRRRNMDLLETGGMVMAVVVYFQGFCFSMYALLKPKTPFAHCSLLIELGWPMWAQIPVKIYETYMLINCWHVILSVWLTLVAGGYSVFRWVNELAPEEENRIQIQQKALDTLRTETNSYSVYQSFEILTTMLNSIIKIWIAGVSFFVGKFIAIYMGYASIKLGMDGTLPMREYLVYPTSCIFLFVTLALLFPEAEKFSTATIEYTKKMKWHSNRTLRKRFRGLRPLAILITDAIRMQHGTFIEVLHDVIDEITDLVISF